MGGGASSSSRPQSQAGSNPVPQPQTNPRTPSPQIPQTPALSSQPDTLPSAPDDNNLQTVSTDNTDNSLQQNSTDQQEDTDNSLQQNSTDQQEVAIKRKFADQFPTPKFLRECNDIALLDIAEKNLPRRGTDGLLRRYPPQRPKQELLSEDDYGRLDDLASEVPDDLLQRPIAELAKRLKRDTKSDAEFIRVAYRWVLFQLIRRVSATDSSAVAEPPRTEDNVDSGSTQLERSALDYMREIRAAKQGPNELLHHILTAGDIESTLVSGVVKSDSREPSMTMSTSASVTISKTGKLIKAKEPADETTTVSLSYRKWLAVVIDENWFLVDAHPVLEHYLEDEPQPEKASSQPAGSTTKQRDVSASPDSSVEIILTSTAASGSHPNFEGYFLPKPETFVYSHFPASELDWQLLYRPASIDEFIQMADLTPAFFRYGLELGKRLRRSIEHNETTPCSLTLGQPKDACYRYNYRLTRLKSSNSGNGGSSSTPRSSSSLDRFVFVENLSSSEKVRCTMRFPSVGKYLFELFCCKSTKSTDDLVDRGLYLLVCRYQIEVNRPAAEQTPLPENRFREWGPGWKLKQAGLDTTTFMSGTNSLSGEIDVRETSQTPGEVDVTFNVSEGNDESKYLVQISSDSKSTHDMRRYSILFAHSDDDNRRYLTVKAKFVETGWYAMTLLAKDDDDAVAADKRKSVSRFDRVCCYLIKVTRAAADKRPYPKVASGRLGRTEEGDHLGIYPVSHRTSFLKVRDEDELAIVFASPTEPCHFTAELRLQIDSDDGSKQFNDMIFIEERSDEATFRVRFPEKGLYTIRMFARPRSSNDSQYVPVFTYIVDVSRPTAKFGPFPRKGAHWAEGCRLLQPTGLAGILPADSLIPFSVVIPKAVEVKLIKSDNLEETLRRRGNVDENENEYRGKNVNENDDDGSKDPWTADFNTGKEGELVLQAAFDSTTLRFEPLLTFQVIDVGRVTVIKKAIGENGLRQSQQQQQQQQHLPVNTQPPPPPTSIPAAAEPEKVTKIPEVTRSNLQQSTERQVPPADNVLKPPQSRSPPPSQRSGALKSSPHPSAVEQRNYDAIDEEQRRIERKKALERMRERIIMEQQLLAKTKARQEQSQERGENSHREPAVQNVRRIREDLQKSIMQQDSVGLLIAVNNVEKYHLQDVIGDDYYRACDVMKSLNRVDKLKSALISLDRATLSEIRAYNNPPEPLHRVVAATLLVLGIPEQQTKTWQNCQHHCSTVGPDNLLRRVEMFDVRRLHPEIAARAEQMLKDCRRKDVRDACFGAAIFYDWTTGVCDECLRINGSREVKPATDQRQRQLLKVSGSSNALVPT